MNILSIADIKYIMQLKDENENINITSVGTVYIPGKDEIRILGKVPSKDILEVEALIEGRIIKW